MNAAQAHEAATQWVAGTLGLTVNRTLFMGPPPPGLGEYAALECMSGTGADSSSLNRLLVTLTLRRHTQSAAETLLATLEGALPRFGVSGFCAIELTGECKRTAGAEGYTITCRLQLFYQ